MVLVFKFLLNVWLIELELILFNNLLQINNVINRLEGIEIKKAVPTIEINQKRTKNWALKLIEFLLIVQAFVNYCSLRQVQQKKNNNAIKTKFIPTSLNLIKRYV